MGLFGDKPDPVHTHTWEDDEIHNLLLNAQNRNDPVLKERIRQLRQHKEDRLTGKLEPKDDDHGLVGALFMAIVGVLVGVGSFIEDKPALLVLAFALVFMGAAFYRPEPKSDAASRSAINKNETQTQAPVSEKTRLNMERAALRRQDKALYKQLLETGSPCQLSSIYLDDYDVNKLFGEIKNRYVHNGYRLFALSVHASFVRGSFFTVRISDGSIEAPDGAEEALGHLKDKLSALGEVGMRQAYAEDAQGKSRVSAHVEMALRLNEDSPTVAEWRDAYKKSPREAKRQKADAAQRAPISAQEAARMTEQVKEAQAVAEAAARQEAKAALLRHYENHVAAILYERINEAVACGNNAARVTYEEAIGDWKRLATHPQQTKTMFQEVLVEILQEQLGALGYRVSPYQWKDGRTLVPCRGVCISWA